MIRIGYACLTLAVRGTEFRSCLARNASQERLLEIIRHNLDSLENIIDYNRNNQIPIFRISSDLIPFGSSPVNQLPWWEIFHEELSRIREKIENSGIRVSMHPGQYTVLNSPDHAVVQRAVADLIYHNKILNELGTNRESKIILHVGGTYGNKKLAMKCFEENFSLLDPAIQNRIVLENDDKSYHIANVLDLGTNLGLPVVFDHLHHQVHCCDKTKEDLYWIRKCAGTWGKKDGRQKLHYSQQNPFKKPGSHSESIRTDEFLDYVAEIQQEELDIMLEVKDKNLSAMKCKNLLSVTKKIKDLETEWGRYKYAVLERSPEAYQKIRTLLIDKKEYPAHSFYRWIESGLKQEAQLGHSINAAQHVWGYFKEKATESEKLRFQQTLDQCVKGSVQIIQLKRLLWRLATKYNELYLLNSYYFILNF